LGQYIDKYINNYSRVKPENNKKVELETLNAEWMEHLPNHVL